jgi:hypothetical protein
MSEKANTATLSRGNAKKAIIVLAIFEAIAISAFIVYKMM